MSDWRKKTEEDDEADLLELMELEEELGYSDEYKQKKKNARMEEARKKRKRNQLIREILVVVLFVAATITIVLLVRKCVGDDKNKETTASGKPSNTESRTEAPSGEKTKEPTESKSEAPRTTEAPTTTTEEPTEDTTWETAYIAPTRAPSTTEPSGAPTEPTAPPETAPTEPTETEAPGMVYNGVQLPPYRALQQGDSVAVQSGIRMPSWIVQDLIPTDGAHRPGLAINKIGHVVIHYVGNTLSSAKDNRDYFATPPDSPAYDGRGVSSHFIIGLYGEIIQCVPLNEVAYAQGVSADSGRPNHNWDSISIENSHYNDAGEFTSMTEDSLVKLTAWLLESYGLPANTNTILRHYDCSGKACPKDWADNPAKYEAFVQRVAEYMAAHPNIAAEYP